MQHTLRWAALFVGVMHCALVDFAEAAAPPTNVIAEGHDRRIDVTWEPLALPDDAIGFNVYRATSATGPFVKLNEKPQDFAVYSDYLGANDVQRWYRVTLVEAIGTENSSSSEVTIQEREIYGAPVVPIDKKEYAETAPSTIVTAKTHKMTTDELLTSIQKAHFRYFWHFAHPVSGLAREGFRHKREICTSGGIGFGMMTIMVGAERGFVTREAAAKMLLKQVRFLDEVTSRYHGAWAHWINGATGATIPFSGKKDNGGDIVETAFLVEGMLTIAAYFDRNTPVEKELRERIARMWREVEWDWYLGPDNKNRRLYWHWSPDYEFAKGHRFGGNFNECMITYILALCSPTHAIPDACYYEGWAGGPPRRTGDPTYPNGNEYYGHTLDVGWPYGGPLFFTHYSFIGMDPRYVTDKYTNYYENNRTISLINRAYCIDNPKKFKGYDALTWGLTASFTPGGYHAHEPRADRGTITPTAAISAMPYVPAESIATLEHFYKERGDEIWGHFGFWDAFNPSKDWVSDTFLAIDQGPIAPMIENYRTQLCWRMFMKNDDVICGLKRLGLYADSPAQMVSVSQEARK